MLFVKRTWVYPSKYINKSKYINIHDFVLQSYSNDCIYLGLHGVTAVVGCWRQRTPVVPVVSPVEKMGKVTFRLTVQLEHFRQGGETTGKVVEGVDDLQCLVRD